MTTFTTPLSVQRKRKVTTKRPLPYRFGELILLFLFISLLAGRFSISRLSDSAFGLDLRYVFTFIAVLSALLWVGGAKGHLPQRVPMPGFLVFGMWCLWMILSAGWAPTDARTTEGIVDFIFLFALIGLAWFVMASLPEESLERVWKWLLVTGAIYFALAIAAGPGIQGRYSVPGGGPNIFVRIMIAASIAALYWAIVKRRTWVLWLIPMFAIGAALSGSRGGIVSASAVLVVFLIPLARRLGAKKLLLLLGFIGVGAAIASFWNDGYLVNFVQERFIQQTVVEGYSSGRNFIVDDAWAMFASSPTLGVGLDGYYALQPGSIAVYEHPHNLVLATLTEAGLIGGFILIVALLRMVSTAVSKAYAPGTLFALITGVYFFGTAMFSGDYYDSRFIWFFLALAATSALRRRQGNKVSPAPDLGEIKLTEG